MHFGRKRTVFAPAMGKYVHAVRDGICIIDLIKTQEELQGAIDALNETIAAGGTILWVAPTKQSQDGILALAEATGMPWVIDRWLGGTLTNFKNLNGRVKHLIQLEEDKALGRWDKYTKKEQLDLDRETQDMRRKFEGLKKLNRLPDVVFVASLKEGSLSVHEAKAMGVKIIALSNTDANPADLWRVVPCNDRSKKSVDLLMEAIKHNLVARPAAPVTSAAPATVKA